MTAISHTPANSNPLQAQVGVPSATPTTDKATSKKLDDAASQFEAVFLRQMLSSLEKTVSIEGNKGAGTNLYGSMLVDAVADAISRAGGIGIAPMLKNSLEPQLKQVAGSTTSTPRAQWVAVSGSGRAEGANIDPPKTVAQSDGKQVAEAGHP